MGKARHSLVSPRDTAGHITRVSKYLPAGFTRGIRQWGVIAIGSKRLLRDVDLRCKQASETRARKALRV